MRLLLLIGVAAMFLACSSTTPVDNQGAVPSNLSLSESTADSLWLLRADTSKANRALHAYQQLAAEDTTSLSLWSKLSRAYYFQGQYLNSEQLKRDSLFLNGYEASQSILYQNSEFRNLLFSTGDEKMAVRGLDENSIEALYWGMANYGQWLTTKGALVRLGQRDLIWTTLEHIHDIDSSYYFGAYYRYKGALMARDPNSDIDTLAIRAAFEKAIDIAPDYMGNYTLMAMFYCPLTKDKDLFYSLLTTVITSQLDQSLPYYPENYYEKGRAERLMIKAEKENWFNQ